jgi:predicted transcriptional regulator
MSALAVAKKRLSEDKVEFRADSEFIRRLDAQAERRGMKRSVYIRDVLLRELEQAERAEREQGSRSQED